LIRVTVPEPALAPAALSETSVPTAIPSLSKLKIVLPGKVDWTYGLPAATLAGIVSAVFMVVSLGSSLGMFVTGALAIMYYRRRTPDSDITLRMGAKLGLMTGLIAFGICTALIALVTLFSGTGRLRTYLLEMAKQAPRFGSRPEVQQQWDWLMSPEGFPSLVLGYLFSALVIFLIFSAIGGLLGASWIRFRKRR
jgi:MFS family permease